ncbi:MAG: hypothetical protein CEE40_08405 [Chloroflexi bacterium B3_Chlor]|nr:MAG: hypothetical protein CEE40_08405 [Chloroflexi bacterium B3_Chlor]
MNLVNENARPFDTSHRRRPALSASIPWVIVVVLLASFLALDRPLIRSDGLAYFMWLQSVARDHDLDLANQAEHFAALISYQVFLNEQTGEYASVFPYGSAFLYLPTYWLASAANRLPQFHVNDAYFTQHQGVAFPYSLFPMLGTNLLALLAVVVVFFAARKISSPRASLLSCLALFLATPLLYYSTIEPYMSHVAGTLLTALLIYILVGHREHSPAWFFMGFILGLALLVRWQLALYALPIGLLALVKRQWRELLLLTAGFLLLAWHLPFSWLRMYGNPWVVPAAIQGQQAFLSGPIYVKEVLLSPERGLFLWSPLVLLALIGLLLLLRSERGLAITLALMFLLQVVMNASLYDWGGGWAFGMRRMTELYPVWVIGLATLVEASHSFDRGGLWTKAIRWGTFSLVLVGIAFGLLLLLSHLNYVNTNLDHPEGSALWEEIKYHLTESNLRITAQVIKEHYGIWAWARPGP